MSGGKKRFKEHAARREAGGYVAFPHVVLRSAELAALSPFAVKALVDLLAQYKGDNNGDLCAAWTMMKKRGWRSRDSLGKGLSELREASFLVVTRQGGRHVASLYGVTFFEIDFCGGKLDLKSPTRIFMGTWRKGPASTEIAKEISAKPAIPVTRPSGQSSKNKPAGRVNSSSSLSNRPAGRVSQASFDIPIDTPVGHLSRDTTTRSAFAESV